MIRAFVVGHPIAHSRSPLIHGHWLAEHGIDGRYERIDVAPEAFPAFLAGLRANGFAGGNVTIPHKEAAFGLVESLTPRAERIGAVNTLVVEADGRVFVIRLDAVHPADLGAHVIKAVVERTGIDPEVVDDVIFGCVDTIGPQAGNIARSAWLAAGIEAARGQWVLWLDSDMILPPKSIEVAVETALSTGATGK